MPHQSLQFRIIISIGCQRAPSHCSNSMPATFLLDAPGVRPSELDANAHFCSSSPRPFCVVRRGGGRLKSQTASQSNAQYKLRNNASRFRKGPTCVRLGFAPGPTPSCLIHRKSRGLRNRSIFLTMLFCAATVATCFGVSTYKDSGRLSFTRKETAVKATTSTASHESFQPQPTKITNIAVVIGSAVSNFEVSSHFGPPWEEVLSHINRRLSWLDYDINLITVRVDGLMKDPTNVLKDVSMVVAVGIKDNEAAEKVVEAINSVPSVQTLVSYDSAQPLLTATRMNDLALRDTSQWTMLQRFFDPSGFAAVKKYRAAVDMAVDLFQRKTSDDFLFSFLVLINEAIRPIPDVTNSTKRQDAGLPELKCMIGHCGSEILSCMIDSTCRMALSCLNSCAFNDQVCTYRCIASYESPALENFSLCILQKHNCLNLDVEIPRVPDPEPMTSFRGKPLTHEVAQSLFVGWFDSAGCKDGADKLPFSWRVFAGKNPAYDYFPCQYQLFYPGKAKDSLWYQPVFKVQTLPKGEEVWRDRLYRVRRGSVPGRFDFSVLDNGVTSKEKWSILDCDDSLEWCAFYYNGAAARAGLRYNGAVLVSKTGQWPNDVQASSRLVEALKRAGIEKWELSTVNNDNCEDAPLTPLRDVGTWSSLPS